MEDLWPDDLQQIKVKTPVAILKEQASLLGPKTQNLVEAEVKRSETTEEEGIFYYVFFITAPALGNYRYRLFDVHHGIELYPARIRPDDEIFHELLSSHLSFPVPTGLSESFPVRSADELLEALRAILNAKKTRNVINALRAQASEMEESTPHTSRHIR